MAGQWLFCVLLFPSIIYRYYFSRFSLSFIHRCTHPSAMQWYFPCLSSIRHPSASFFIPTGFGIVTLQPPIHSYTLYSSELMSIKSFISFLLFFQCADVQFPPTKVTSFFLFPKIFYFFRKKIRRHLEKSAGVFFFLPIQRFFQKKKLWADCRFLPFFTDFGGFSQYCWQFFFDTFKQYFSTFYPLFLTYPLPLVRYLEFDTS